jgi:hypothetical protein
MAFEGLSAKIDADASDYNSTVGVAKHLTDELGDEAFEVSAAMQVMASRTDEAGDEAAELAASAGAASAGLGGMGSASVGASNGLNLVSVSAQGLQVSLGPLVAILAAVVVALLGILSAGIAIASLGGLLLGSGLLVFGQQAADRFSEAESAAEGLAQVAKNLQSRIAPILRPLGTAFAPLIQQAVDALPSVVRSIVSAVGPLQSFKSAARAIGGAIARLLPLIIRLGSQAFRELSTELGLAGKTFVDLLPSLTRFGVRVLKVLLPTLSVLMIALRGLLTAVNTLADVIIFAALDALPAFAQAVSDMLIQPMVQAIKTGDKLISRLQQIVGLMRIISGGPGGQAMLASGATAAGGGGATARRAPTTDRRNQARRGNPQARGEADLPSIRVEGDTEVVKDVAYESGQEGARTELERERRRTSDRR